MKKTAMAFLIFINTSAYSQAWFPCGLGTMSVINSMAADTTHNRLFVSGVFTNMDGLTANHIAIWNGSSWSQFIHNGNQEGMQNTVSKVMVWNSNLYMVMNTGSGGNQSIYKTPLDTFNVQFVHTFNGSIGDLVVYHDTLFACGNFSGMMKKWTGTSWLSVTTNLGIGTGLGLWDMEVYNDKIYVGGNFEITSPYVTKDVAAYNNGVWEDVGNNFVANLGDLGTHVYALKYYHDTLYAGGSFSTASNGSPEMGF